MFVWRSDFFRFCQEGGARDVRQVVSQVFVLLSKSMQTHILFFVHVVPFFTLVRNKTYHSAVCLCTHPCKK